MPAGEAFPLWPDFKLPWMENITNVCINSNDDFIQFVKLNDILYLESIDTFTRIVCSNNYNYTLRQCLSQIGEKLPDQNFFKIHKSIIVNVEYIKKIRTKPMRTVVLNGGKELKIAERRYKEFIGFIKSRYLVLT